MITNLPCMGIGGMGVLYHTLYTMGLVDNNLLLLLLANVMILTTTEKLQTNEKRQILIPNTCVIFVDSQSNEIFLKTDLSERSINPVKCSVEMR